MALRSVIAVLCIVLLTACGENLASEREEDPEDRGAQYDQRTDAEREADANRGADRKDQIEVYDEWQRSRSEAERSDPRRYDCEDFQGQRDAQRMLEDGPSGDPYDLDDDNDGIACEWLAP